MIPKKTLQAILLILLLSPPHISAEPVSAEYIPFPVNSASSTGRGSTGITEDGTEYFFFNPASIAGVDNYSFSLNYGTHPFQVDYSYPAIAAGFPTSFGTFGIALHGLSIREPADMEYGGGISLGMGRFLTSSLSFGWSLNALYGKEESSLTYTGLSLGTIYRVGYSTKGNGMGIYRPRIGVSVNGGISRGEKRDMVDRNGFCLGYSFSFFQNSQLEMRFSNELAREGGQSPYPVRAGLETTILNRYRVRAGAAYPLTGEITTFSMGLGYRFGGKKAGGDLNYSLVRFKDTAFVHYLGLNMNFSLEDRLPPATRIVPDNSSISPNNDGSQDYVTFHLTVSDTSPVKGWKLQILDFENGVIREYKTPVREFSKELTAGELLQRIFRRKESAVVPKTIIWDGKNGIGLPVKDGVYRYRFNAWDNRDNISVVKKGVIRIDTVPPEIEIKTAGKLLSPGGPETLRKIFITQKSRSAPADVWTGEIKDNGGRTLISYTWKGAVPDKITWDGRDKEGKPAPEGLYRYSVSTRDAAGNSAGAEIDGITLIRSHVIAYLHLSGDLFSHGKEKEMKIYPYLSGKRLPIKWIIRVTDSGGTPLKTFSGKGKIPSFLSYNLTGKEGKPLEDGIYTARLAVEFSEKEKYHSPGCRFRVDSTQPVLSISHSPWLFSPDNDSIDDILHIDMDSQDSSGISRWIVRIYSSSGSVFRYFSGKGKIPVKILWNGKNYKNELVESASDYFIELTAEDRAGNASVSGKERVPVDILVEDTGTGYRIVISRIEFGYKNSLMDPSGKNILNKACEKIKRYGNYRIHVEAHTDDIGDEKENLQLSEKRAERVMKYLVSKGLPAADIDFSGMGETEPLYPGTGEESRRRNRRIVIKLAKKEGDTSSE